MLHETPHLDGPSRRWLPFRFHCKNAALSRTSRSSWSKIRKAQDQQRLRIMSNEIDNTPSPSTPLKVAISLARAPEEEWIPSRAGRSLLCEGTRFLWLACGDGSNGEMMLPLFARKHSVPGWKHGFNQPSVCCSVLSVEPYANSISVAPEWKLLDVVAHKGPSGSMALERPNQTVGSCNSFLVN